MDLIKAPVWQCCRSGDQEMSKQFTAFAKELMAKCSNTSNLQSHSPPVEVYRD